ncbi:hypothetical protein PR003_g8180 [Phytophthora rubi]|uniref:Uncharacterized protein n=1 Tax=Phytophthora rubi TaxID=129364 RepID=A0A6A3K4I5_9STRA|nr:hypothetical protein PR002_g18527 [Phytophthora rubi]KAE9039257.1 hypothetical protein PR001_g7583 [Phytophthora rubi]KAE9344986.1 hypothetical protein PR003_g8180 [Phytophthora rubi]
MLVVVFLVLRNDLILYGKLYGTWSASRCTRLALDRIHFRPIANGHSFNLKGNLWTSRQNATPVS